MPGQEKEHLIAIGVHLAAMGCVSDHHGRPDCEPIHSGRGTGPVRDELCRAVAEEPYDDLRQIEGLAVLTTHRSYLERSTRQSPRS